MTVRIVPKKTRDDVYKFLFTEGGICCKKDRSENWHGKLGEHKFQVPVHHVWYLMRSLESRGLVREQFNWRHFYWILNDDGIAFIRKYFHLADSVVPNSMKPMEEDKLRSFERRPPRPEGARGGRGGRGAGRGGEGGRGRGRGGYGADRAEYQGEGGRGRGGRGFGRGRGRGGAPAEGAEGAAPAAAPAAPAQE